MTSLLRSLILTLLSSLPVLSQSYVWSTTAQYGFFKADGFVLNNCRWNGELGSMFVDTGLKRFSYWTTHTNFQKCCSSPYCGIGTLGGTWTADNNSLPVKLKDLEVLKSSWTFTVPMPVRAGYSTQAYHVYYEIFMSTAVTGERNAGNIAIPMWDVAFYHQPTYGSRVTVKNYTMDVKFNGANPNNQGPFWVMCLMDSTLKPDANGRISVTNFDIKACIDYGISQGTYSPDIYLTEVNCAFEVMTLPGDTLKTNSATFIVKAVGKDTVYTPAWSKDYWTSVLSTINPDSHLDHSASRGVHAKDGALFDISGRLLKHSFSALRTGKPRIITTRHGLRIISSD